ncbi:MAG: hypothetical protein Q4B26_19705 [Eubacteriales bacterium]|nr:hypothetical protein [Eubacteriales bacterium]
MHDEQIKEIEQVFDTEYKHNQYDQKKREKYKIEVLHIEGMLGQDGEVGTFDIPDSAVDIEEDFIHRCDLERLQEVLSLLSDEDREFLLDCFNYEADYIKRLSTKYGITGSAVRWKKEKLLKVLREKFFE